MITVLLTANTEYVIQKAKGWECDVGHQHNFVYQSLAETPDIIILFDGFCIFLSAGEEGKKKRKVYIQVSFRFFELLLWFQSLSYTAFTSKQMNQQTNNPPPK